MITNAAPQTAPAPRERMVHVVQGQYEILNDPNAVLSTVLGSCVAACVRDPLLRIGGMNHFLLPGETNPRNDSLKYGVQAMELLINGLLQRGAARERLEAKLFGGARVVEGLSDIGQQNAEFAARFLRTENIRCVGESLGGDRPRRIRFWPTTGRVIQLFLDRADPAAVTVERVRPAPVAPAPTGDLELF
ncbi:chemotaxis protein CheD [alpha proteobacterium U9-1i]|nr:chemotaxis protein CheD [alpha proteobacterium U9-1i]